MKTLGAIAMGVLIMAGCSGPSDPEPSTPEGAVVLECPGESGLTAVLSDGTYVMVGEDIGFDYGMSQDETVDMWVGSGCTIVEDYR